MRIHDIEVAHTDEVLIGGDWVPAPGETGTVVEPATGLFGGVKAPSGGRAAGSEGIVAFAELKQTLVTVRAVVLSCVVATILTACGGTEDPPVAASATSSAAASSVASTTSSTTELVPAARGFVDAWNAGDAEAMLALFTPTATLIDAGRTFNGRTEIREFVEPEVAGYRIRVISAEPPRPDGQRILVEVVGNSGGSFRATFDFTTSGALITKADLQYA